MLKWLETKINENFLQKLIVLFIVVLMTLSILAVIYGIIELILNYRLSIGSNGLEEFLKVFLKYKEIFGGLFIAIASLLAIKQLVEIKRNNYRSMWFAILKEELNEIRLENEYIYRNILLQSNDIYDFASSRGFKIQNKDDLKDFMDRFFSKSVPVYELYDSNYKKYSGYYHDKENTHAERRFLNAFIRLMQPSKPYLEDFTKDFLILYREYLFEKNEFNNPIINAKIYEKKTQELIEKENIK
ncbi:MAG: hypothetical protein MUO72_03840 [Bacteroidales bacterium]|nr:hypothetical protein [Bacteroidales bacterium]